MPREVENLLEITRIKMLAREAYILKVNQKQENIVFHFEKEHFNTDCIDKLMKIYRNRIKFSPATEPYITFKVQNIRNVLSEIQEFLQHLK